MSTADVGSWHDIGIWQVCFLVDSGSWHGTQEHTQTHTYLKDVWNAEHAQSSQMPQPNADMQTNAATLHTAKCRLEISAFDLCKIAAFHV